MRRLGGTGPADERGAILVMVAAATVAIVAMAALVVDVGSLLDEKRQLQNGADAAALGVAQVIAETCPAGPCTASVLMSTAQGLANGNATDGAARVDSVTPNFATKQVAVVTSTLGTSGGSILPYWFGQAVTGTTGKTVRATAAATWGGLSRASVIPLTASKCEFDRATVNGTVFNVPVIILFHGKAASCAGGNGLDIPGGYGWLKDNNDGNPDDCNVTPSAGDTVQDDTGVPGTPHSCNLAALLGTDVLLSVYDGLTGSGSGGVYHLYGFGELHLTGYRFSSSNSAGVVPCASPNTCIGGYFIRFVSIGDYGGPNLGNRVALVS